MGKQGRITATESIGKNTRLITIEVDEDLGFVGGKWVMINTGLTTPEGKAAKRAYSILSPDTQQRQFQLAVRSIESGITSVHLQDLQAGAEIEIGGPYGKAFHIQENDPSGSLLIIATDTGITAALGILQSQKAQPYLGQARLIWLVEDESYFLPKDFVLSHLPELMRESFEIVLIPPIRDSFQRIEMSRARVEEILKAERPALVFISGDGNLTDALSQVCRIQGVDESFVRVEPFFNTEKKKPSPAILRS